MKPLNLADRRNKITVFVVMLAIILCLVFLMAAAILKGNDTSEKIAIDNSEHSEFSSEADRLFGYNEKLQARMASLQQLDEQYSLAITGNAFTLQSDSLNELIEMEENVFRGTINSINQNLSSLTDAPAKARLQKMIASYQSLLEGRRAVASLRNAVAIQHSNFGADEKAMLEMQDQVMQKNSRIAALESSVKEMEKSRKSREPAIAVSQDTKGTVTLLQNTVTNLTSYNVSLKQENEKLQKQQNENSKKAVGNEVVLKERAAALQQKIDALNADLQLARVDCNLSRVDALQIISNAKQRKQLLSEASDILINLSATASDDVKKKVKDKISRLNQVAANSRE